MHRFDQVPTRRLLMRRWTAADVDAMAALNADPEVMRHFPAMPNRQATQEAVNGWEAKFDTQGYGLWALERREDQAMLGMTGLNPLPPAAGIQGLEVGWRLARYAWGKGYATEAAEAALEVARKCGLREIWSFTAELNTRSQAVMRRLNLTLVKKLDHPNIPIGHPLRPHVLFHADL